jgi:hypothetical protein
MMKPDQERVRVLLTETVMLLCKNGLQFSKQLKVQGLLGITLDNSDVFLVHIDDNVSSLVAPFAEEHGNVAETQSAGAESVESQNTSTVRRSHKVPVRPNRPTSRFGHRFGRDTSFKARRTPCGQLKSKNIHQSSLKSRPQRAAALVTAISVESDAPHADALSVGRACVTDVKNEDDDVIIVDQKVDPDDDNLNAGQCWTHT